MELTKDFIDNDLDARVAAGDKALELTLGRIRKTITLLEPMVEILRVKSKPKSLHTVDIIEESLHTPRTSRWEQTPRIGAWTTSSSTMSGSLSSKSGRT